MFKAIYLWKFLSDQTIIYIVRIVSLWSMFQSKKKILSYAALNRPTQHKILAHYKRFEVRRVSRPCLDWLCSGTSKEHCCQYVKGYHTFQDIVTLFSEYNIELKPCSFDGKCSMTTNSSTTLTMSTRLAYLLGFNNNNWTVSPGTTSVYDNMVNINKNQKYVKAHSNIINPKKNIFNGDRSHICVYLVQYKNMLTLNLSAFSMVLLINP